MKKINIVLFALIPLLFGCDKFLNIKPKGFTIPEYYEDYVKIMNAASLGKAGDHYLIYLTDDVQRSDGDSVNSFNSLSGSALKLYTFEGGDIFEPGGRDVDNLWSGSYNRIYSFNTVINNVESVDDATREMKLKLKAEAIIGRAFDFFTLVNVYGKAYNSSTAKTDYGIPIVESEDVANLKYQRSSVAEVYAKIEKDLEEALPYLDERVPHSFIPAKNVGFAFRAKIYLQKGEFDKALIDAKAALNLNSELVDLNKYGIKPGNVTIGRICKLPELIDRYPDGIDNPENIYTKYAPTVYQVNGNVFASQDLLNVYKKDLLLGQEDMRRKLWFSDDKLTTRSFPGRTIWAQYIRSNVGLNNMEIILIAAECHARAGSQEDLQEAARLYNLLRKHRISNYSDVTFNSADEALAKILDERRREFPFQSTFRYTDLKRLNREPAHAKVVTHTANGMTWTLPPNDNRWIIPVPPQVKALNPNILEYER